jgi:hypothetical protein
MRPACTARTTTTAARSNPAKSPKFEPIRAVASRNPGGAGERCRLMASRSGMRLPHWLGVAAVAAVVVIAYEKVGKGKIHL